MNKKSLFLLHSQVEEWKQTLFIRHKHKRTLRAGAATLTSSATLRGHMNAVISEINPPAQGG